MPLIHRNCPTSSRNGWRRAIPATTSDAWRRSMRSAAGSWRNGSPTRPGSASALLARRRGGCFARKAIGHQVGAVGSALGADEVLLAIVHVGHGGAGLHLVHEYRAFLLAAGLVIGPQPRAFASLLVGEEAAITADDQRFGGQRSQDAGLAGAGNGDAFEQAVVLDRVGRLAMHDLPDLRTFAEIDAGDGAVRRFHQGNAFDRDHARHDRV